MVAKHHLSNSKISLYSLLYCAHAGTMWHGVTWPPARAIWKPYGPQVGSVICHVSYVASLVVNFFQQRPLRLLLHFAWS